jgi:hypothetical protein
VFYLVPEPKVGFFNGALSTVPVAHLGAAAINGARERVGEKKIKLIKYAWEKLSKRATEVLSALNKFWSVLMCYG